MIFQVEAFDAHVLRSVLGEAVLEAGVVISKNGTRRSVPAHPTQKYAHLKHHALAAAVGKIGRRLPHTDKPKAA